MEHSSKGWTQLSKQLGFPNGLTDCSIHVCLHLDEAILTRGGGPFGATLTGLDTTQISK